MHTLYVFALAALAIVFALAGLGKLTAGEQTRKAVIDLGAPATLAEPVARVLPYFELAIAVLFLPSVSRWYAGTLSAILLSIFLAATTLAYVRGSDADCNCLGRFGSGKIGASAIIRNIVLVFLSVIVVASSKANLFHSDGKWSTWLPIGVAALAGLATMLVLKRREQPVARPLSDTSAESPFRWPLEELAALSESRSRTQA